MRSSLVISIDFELHWGVRDHMALTEFMPIVKGTRQAVLDTLRLFEAARVRATWAPVGFLLFASRNDLAANLPRIRPTYRDRSLSPYEELSRLGEGEADDPCHFAPSLIGEIVQTKGQELGSHTLSHYFCLADGQTIEQFVADISVARDVTRRKFGVDVKSLVFPRNQVNGRYLDACASQGLIAYRGVGSGLLGRSTSRSFPWRTLRLLDALFPLSRIGSGHNQGVRSQPPVNVAASRFLRFFTGRLERLAILHRNRVRQEMSSVARNGGTYHLWWHPHNLGARPAESLAFLAQVLTDFDDLRRRFGMQSLTMADAAEACGCPTH